MNSVCLLGRLTADPELRQTQSQIPVLSFTIAVDRAFQPKGQEQRQADFINLVAWRQTAEFISRYFHKGSCLCVTGSIQTRNWQDQQGQKRYATEVVVDEAMFVDSKSESGASNGYTPDAYNTSSFSTGSGETGKFEDVNTDDTFLPF